MHGAYMIQIHNVLENEAAAGFYAVAKEENGLQGMIIIALEMLSFAVCFLASWLMPD
jgi:hypothetical protein